MTDGSPAVIVFYRRAWCPDCNIALKTCEDQLLPGLTERGVALVAVSPQKPDGTHTLTMPTVAVTDADHIVCWIDVHSDFTTRSQPADILAALDKARWHARGGPDPMIRPACRPRMTAACSSGLG